MTYRVCLLTGAITLLPEADATPHTDSGESTLDALPQVLRDRVDPQLRPISDGRRKRKRRDAQNYISEQIWQPQFSQMFPGSVAVWLAPDADSESAYAFRISVGRGTKSGWLNIGVVDSIDRDTKTILPGRIFAQGSSQVVLQISTSQKLLLAIRSRGSLVIKLIRLGTMMRCYFLGTGMKMNEVGPSKQNSMIN